MIKEVMKAQIKTLLNSAGYVKKSVYLGMLALASGSKTSKPPEYNEKEIMNSIGNEVWVYACCDLIAKEIAGLEMKAWKKSRSSKGETVWEETESDALKLLANPNPYDTYNLFLQSLQLNIDLTGNRYILKDSDGTKTNLYSLISSCVEIMKGDSKNKIAGYKYRVEGSTEEKDFKYEDIIHGRYIDPRNDYRGLSPLSAARLTIDTLVYARNSNYNIYKNGAKFDGYFKSDNQLDDEVFKRLKDQLKLKFDGVEHHHETPLLEGIDFKQLTIPLRDLEYINGMKLGMQEICAIFKVPPQLFLMDSSTYNNLVEAQKFLYKYCIIPRLRILRDELQRLESNPEIYLEFDLSNVEALRESVKDLATTAKAFFDMGVPFNRIINALNLPFDPIPGGDTGYLPFGLSPVGSQAEPGNTPPDNSGKSLKKTTKIVWTEERKVAKWKVFHANVTALENKYKELLVPYFKKQEKTVIENINKFKGFGYEKVAEKTFIIYAQDPDGAKKAVNIESILFDEDGEIEDLRKISSPIYREAIAKQGKTEYESLDLSGVFDVTNPRVSAWIKKVGLQRAKTVVGTAKADLRDALVQGINDGESIVDLTQRIRDVYSEYGDIEQFKLRRIAQTEVIGAANEGALESYRQGGVAGKGWLSARNDKVRDTHREAEAKYIDGIPLEADFHVGGGSGKAPGQIGLPEEDINCHCSIIPITELPDGAGAAD